MGALQPSRAQGFLVLGGDDWLPGGSSIGLVTPGHDGLYEHHPCLPLPSGGYVTEDGGMYVGSSDLLDWPANLQVSPNPNNTQHEQIVSLTLFSFLSLNNQPIFAT